MQYTGNHHQCAPPRYDAKPARFAGQQKALQWRCYLPWFNPLRWSGTAIYGTDDADLIACMQAEVVSTRVNLVARADFVLFRFDFTEKSTLETTPGINQFDWLIMVS